MKRFIIDGYNLLHVLGLMKPHMTAAGLIAARTRLLDMLAEGTKERSVLVTVVFDAANAPKRIPAEDDYRGITILAAKHEEADDLIEGLVQRDATPRALTVISNDRRLIKTAQRRGCVSMHCEEFLDWLLQSPPPRASQAGEPAAAVPAETEHWLREFGHLDTDPDLGRPLEFPE
jgi:uncharacterized protein